MNSKGYKKILSSISLFAITNFAYPQEGGGGGESTAEASVTTSSSKKSKAAPEAIESNPIVTVVRAGINLSTAKNMGVSGVRKVAKAGGSFSNLRHVSKAIGSGSVDHTHVLAAVDAGLTRGGDGADLHFLKAAVKIGDGVISTEHLDSLATTLGGEGMDFDKLFNDHGFSADNHGDFAIAVQNGYTGSHLEHLDISNLTDAIAKGVTINVEDAESFAKHIKDGKDITHISNALAKGYTHEELSNLNSTELEVIHKHLSEGLDKNAADTALNSGIDSSLSSFLSDLLVTTENELLKDTFTKVLGDALYTAPEHQAALTAAANTANTLLRDVTIASASDLPTPINVASFANNGYNTELVKILVKYGAIGSKGSELATAAINGFSTSSSSSSNLKDLLQDSTSGYLTLLSTLTGNSDLGDPDGDNDNFMQSTVLKVNLDKINLIPGSSVSLGTKDAVSNIDVSAMLSKAASTADRKVLVIGAAKDLTITGDITFTNSNDVEDHALAIGAADDFYLRSEYSSQNSADYDNPDPVNIKYTGSNLGLGSEDTMRLVNVNIETGGNLAIGTLDELHIGLSDSHSSTFSVGTGGKNSDPDNVYLVANNLIQVNGLNFSGRLDDVYMEAITINLKDVAFPSTADVMLRSRDGTLHFNTFNNRVIGGVNLTDVSHGGINLSPAHFDNGPAGHIDSSIALPNGSSAIKIRKQ